MDVIKIAKDSGFLQREIDLKYGQELEQFAKLVRAETKEECARKVEQFRSKMDAGIDHIAEAIRSL